MKIKNIEDSIEKISDINIVPIVELIVDAVRTYPLYELNDTEAYFHEIMKLLNSKEISLESLKSYMDNNSNFENEKTIWVSDSLYSIIEAFELMRLYKISFIEVLRVIEDLK